MARTRIIWTLEKGPDCLSSIFIQHAAASKPPQSSCHDASWAAREYKLLASYSSLFSSAASARASTGLQSGVASRLKSGRIHANPTRNKNERKTPIANSHRLG